MPSNPSAIACVVFSLYHPLFLFPLMRMTMWVVLHTRLDLNDLLASVRLVLLGGSAMHRRHF